MTSVYEEISGLIRPLIKGIPIIIFCLILFVFLANRIDKYAQRVYESKASIKIDNRDYGISNFYLFDRNIVEEGNRYNYFLAEVELFKSPDLWKKTLEKLDFGVEVHRIGDFARTELYEKSPFTIEYEWIKNNDVKTIDYHIIYRGSNLLEISRDAVKNTIQLGECIVWDELAFTVELNKNQLKRQPSSLSIGDKFELVFVPKVKQVKNINHDNFFIKTFDKDVPIVELYYRSNSPLKSQHFLQAFLTTFLEETESTKRNRTKAAKSLIDNKIAHFTGLLNRSEDELAYYKSNNRLAGGRLEVDGSIKKLRELEILLMKYESEMQVLNGMKLDIKEDVKKQHVKEVFKLLDGTDVQGIAQTIPTWEGDNKEFPIYNEASKEAYIQAQQDYKEEVNQQISSALNILKTKSKNIKGEIAGLLKKLKKYPHKEKDLHHLQRKMKLDEQMYTYLIEKRTELGIVESFNQSFHQVFTTPTLSTRPVWPNKALLIGLFAFLGLIMGMILSYVFYFLFSKLEETSLIKRFFPNKHILQIPEFATIQEQKSYFLWFTNKHIDSNNKYIVVSTPTIDAAQSSFTLQWAKQLAASGSRVLLVDLNQKNGYLTRQTSLQKYEGISDFFMTEKQNVPQYYVEEYQLWLSPLGQSLEALMSSSWNFDLEQKLASLDKEFDKIFIELPSVGEHPFLFHTSNPAWMYIQMISKNHLFSFKAKRLFKRYNYIFNETQLFIFGHLAQAK